MAQELEALYVKDEVAQRRAEMRRKRMRPDEDEEDEEIDPIKNLVEKGPDPNFFGIPYIFIENAHIFLGLYAVLCCFFADPDIENVLFEFQGESLAALRAGTGLVFVLNFINGLFLGKEELDVGPDRGFSALGWFVKAFFLGGVASWQRQGRISKELAKREEAAAKRAAGVA